MFIFSGDLIRDFASQSPNCMFKTKFHFFSKRGRSQSNFCNNPFIIFILGILLAHRMINAWSISLVRLHLEFNTLWKSLHLFTIFPVCFLSSCLSLSHLIIFSIVCRPSYLLVYHLLKRFCSQTKVKLCKFYFQKRGPISVHVHVLWHTS